MPDSAAPPIGKAVACLVDARGRLLVFDHPQDGGAQLVKGTIEPGEAPEDAVRRELLEESGLRFDGPLIPLGTLPRDCAAGEESARRRHPQLWHLFLMRHAAPLPEHFEHTAHGSPEEDGLVFAFRWLAPGDALDAFAPPYRQAIERVWAALRDPRPDQ